jgi:hypothetical protein
MGNYRTFGTALDRVFRNDLNSNFQDIAADIEAQKTRVNNILTGTSQPSEVVDARGGKAVLKDRLDAVDASLAEKLTKGEVSVSDIDKNKGKFDQTYMTDEFLQQMAGTTPINAVPANASLVKEKFIKKSISSHVTDFIVVGKNLFNKNAITKGYWVNPSTGNLEVASGYVVSDYIPVEASTTYTRKKGTWANTYSHYYFDSQFNKISGAGTSADVKTFTTPANAAYIRLNIADGLEGQEQLEIGSVETAYEAYGNKFASPFVDVLANIDAYPFQSNATFTNTTAKTEIKKAVKKIEVIGADKTKKYCLGIIQRNFSTYGTGAYIYEADPATGATTKIVAMTSSTSYVEPSGIDVFNLAEYQGSGITGKIYIDWTQITSGSQYVNTHYDKAGLDVRTYLDKIQDSITISLPDKINAVIGDTLELFYRGIVQSVNPFNYNIKVVASKGNTYKNRWIYTPQAGDTDFNLTFTVYNDKNVKLAEKVCLIKISSVKTSPSTPKNLLLVGDSLMGGGEIAGEFKRRLTGTGGTPVGNGLTNINFIGTVNKNNANFEGYGGWQWQSFNSNSIPPKYWVTVTSGMKTDAISEQSIWKDSSNNQWQLETRDVPNSKLKFKQYPAGGSYVMPTSGTLTFVSGGGDTTAIAYNSATAEASNPFWNSGTSSLDFAGYCSRNGYSGIDYCYILLGWNNITMTGADLVVEGKKFVDKLHSEYPNCKVVIMGLEVPSIDGLGANYAS